jgi:hypothetical protein
MTSTGDFVRRYAIRGEQQRPSLHDLATRERSRSGHPLEGAPLLGGHLERWRAVRRLVQS